MMKRYYILIETTKLYEKIKCHNSNIYNYNFEVNITLTVKMTSSVASD